MLTINLRSLGDGLPTAEILNDLAEVHGLPWWTYHAHAQQDIMTYVDMVFPFFLFIVGMSMPLAINRRLKKNPSMASLWLHVLSRSAGLVVLGLILANAEKADPVRMGLNPNVWALLGLAGAVLFWFAPSRGLRGSRVFRWLRIVGLVLLVLTFALFRRSSGHGTGVWIDGSYPEILGLIGYTYLAASILYIPFRRWLWAPLAWMVALTAFCGFLIAHHVRLHVSLYFWPFGSGALVSITMAGVVTSSIFLGPHRWQSLAQRMQLAFGFAAAMFVSGRLLDRVGGVGGRRRGAGAKPAAGAPRRDADRDHASSLLRRRRRHQRQDDNHHDDRSAARRGGA